MEGNRTSPVLNRVTLRIDNDDRIALLGANGNGKSTLVKLLANRLAPFSGSVTRAEKLSIAYFAQHQLDELNPDATVYEHVRELVPDAHETKIRALAGAIGFSGLNADKKVEKLSGGEKARLVLALLVDVKAHQPLPADHSERRVQGIEVGDLDIQVVFVRSLRRV